jgi:hypothetical protein
MVEGPNDIYICSNCTDLCQNIFTAGAPARLQRAAAVQRAFHAPEQIKEFPRPVRHRPGSRQEGAVGRVHNHYKR